MFIPTWAALYSPIKFNLFHPLQRPPDLSQRVVKLFHLLIRLALLLFIHLGLELFPTNITSDDEIPLPIDHAHGEILNQARDLKRIEFLLTLRAFIIAPRRVVLEVSAGRLSAFQIAPGPGFNPHFCDTHLDHARLDPRPHHRQPILDDQHEIVIINVPIRAFHRLTFREGESVRPSSCRVFIVEETGGGTSGPGDHQDQVPPQAQGNTTASIDPEKLTS